MNRSQLSLFFLLMITGAWAQDVTQYVDPTIGNVARFLVPTYPTAHLPNQMIRAYPEKGDYLTDQVKSFPLQIAGHRNQGLFQFKVLKGTYSERSLDHRMVIDHDLQEVHPWAYATYLIEDELWVRFAPGRKAAIYQFETQKQEPLHWVISGSGDLSATLKGNVLKLRDKIRYTTRGTSPEHRVMDVFAHVVLTDEYGKALKDLKLDVVDNRYILSVANASHVQMKYGISYISAKQAAFNYGQELANAQLEGLAAAGKEIWQNTLGQIQVTGGSDAQRRTFYTALYRTYERMVDINEYGQYYSGYDDQVHQSERPFYVDDWVWDTYLAQHPLRTILNPQLEGDMLHSYTEMYRQSGWMPTFPQVYGNHLCMNAYHSSAIFLDGYRKGIRNYEVSKAYEGIKKNLTQGTFIPWRQGISRRSIDDFYHQKGYFPALAIGQEESDPMMDGFEKRQPVPVTLGISYDFWAMTQLAEELGIQQDVRAFADKANDYKNLWHPEHRLFMPKDESGAWVPIDPKLDGGLGYREYYDENNGWTYAWDVKHDIDGLVELLGGKQAAEDRLDQLFREPLGIRKSQFYVNGSNSTGMVGQFSMGNEPSFHIPYLYNYFGAPWKTQKRTRFLLDVWFKDNIFGIPGDEDGGGMTAFVVFTSMGIYPVTPGVPQYAITSPVFEKVIINLTNGKQFTIIAEGASQKNKYIQRAFLNGKEIFTPFISHEEIMSGATLELELAAYPNKNWGK
ncbi:GH92 family glycosyl hydrolase [Marinoscillum furvescens]|uniref:Putative alpha-1,2-mannosidase n=1 Tax=Marinoscillum furvescens DSM 4134 TaxID=1122208 RepID=A0A3D9KYU9_MARFU|nr:GH92 family glycosyl hydrolase [Marinoscillum furvescens]RED94971.1 putative alpha-1,2-mannosidase [Marinoscillum furvescens DSM 4134]